MLEKALFRPRKTKARSSINKESRQIAARVLLGFHFRQADQSRSQQFSAVINPIAEAFAIIASEAGASVDHFQACLFADRVGEEFLQMESAQRMVKSVALFLAHSQELIMRQRASIRPFEAHHYVESFFCISAGNLRRIKHGHSPGLIELCQLNAEERQRARLHLLAKSVRHKYRRATRENPCRSWPASVLDQKQQQPSSGEQCSPQIRQNPLALLWI